MPLAATVLIPTHNHGPLLAYSVASVLRQTVNEIELFIIGDGADDATRTVAQQAARSDSRVRFFDMHNGPRLGELHRHAALQEACGEIICYHCDDDLMLPSHVESMRTALHNADFAHAAPIFIRADGRVGWHLGHLALPELRQRLQNQKWNFISLSGAAHTLDFYRRLPHGWRSAPSDIWSDLHMWRQILSIEDCRAVTHLRATVLHFPSPPRKEWSLARREVELAAWSELSVQPDFAISLTTESLDAIVRIACRFEIDWKTTAAALDSQTDAMRSQMNEMITLRREYEAVRGTADLVPEITRHLEAAHAEIHGLRQELAEQRIEIEWSRAHVAHMTSRIEQIESELRVVRDELADERTALASEREINAAQSSDLAARQTEIFSHLARVAVLENEFHAIEQTLTWRVRRRLIQRPWLAAIIRAVARRVSRHPAP